MLSSARVRALQHSNAVSRAVSNHERATQYHRLSGGFGVRVSRHSSVERNGDNHKRATRDHRLSGGFDVRPSRQSSGEAWYTHASSNPVFNLQSMNDCDGVSDVNDLPRAGISPRYIYEDDDDATAADAIDDDGTKLLWDSTSV
jgi:hypothetical protein